MARNGLPAATLLRTRNKGSTHPHALHPVGQRHAREISRALRLPSLMRASIHCAAALQPRWCGRLPVGTGARPGRDVIVRCENAIARRRRFQPRSGHTRYDPLRAITGCSMRSSWSAPKARRRCARAVRRDERRLRRRSPAKSRECRRALARAALSSSRSRATSARARCRAPSALCDARSRNEPRRRGEVEAFGAVCGREKRLLDSVLEPAHERRGALRIEL